MCAYMCVYIDFDHAKIPYTNKLEVMCTLPLQVLQQIHSKPLSKTCVCEAFGGLGVQTHFKENSCRDSKFGDLFRAPGRHTHI